MQYGLPNPGLVLLAALFACIAVSAQVGPAQATTSEATYTLSGTVQNSVTGDPIPHALVQVFARSQQTIFTDAAGRFELDHLPAGTFSVFVRKPGFINPNELDPTAPQPLLTVGPNAAPATLKLIPEGVVFGRMQKPDGEPIGYLTVQLFYSDIADGRKRWNLMNSAETNEDGEFRIAGLKPGRYYLEAGPRRQTTWIGAPGQRAREAAYQPVFYPGVSDLASAAPIDVSAGQQVEADLTLSPLPVFQVSGSIIGLPASDWGDQVWPRVQVLSRMTNLAAMPVGAESGNEFRAKVPAGSYVLRADVDTQEGPYRGEVPITVQSDLQSVNVAVVPNPPARIEISVQRTRAALNAGRGAAQVNLHFISQAMKLPNMDNIITAGGGAVNFIQPVDPGIYAVEISSVSPEFYVDSAQCGGTDLLHDNLTVALGPLPPIRIVVRDDGGTVSGTVIADGHGAAGTVLLIPDRAARQIKTVSSALDGHFQSQKLAPGDYTMLAFDRIAGLEYANPEVTNAYSSYATHVSVTANGESKVSLNLVRTAK